MSQLEQQMRHRDREMVPKFLVQGMFALMIGTVGLVAYAQFTDQPQLGVVYDAPIAQTRTITLIGDRTGIYSAFDADGSLLAISNADKAGFIGVIGRVIDRQRQVLGAAADAPINVIRRDNGNIAIMDPATAMNIELIGYGADNVAAFAAFLD